MTARELNRATLARQLLLERGRVPVAEAVDRLGGLQAQEPRPPFLALWSRLEGFEREDLRRALHDGSVVRAMLMRATLHLVGRERYARIRPALADAMTRAMSGALRGRDAGLELGEVLPAAERLLEARPRTFGELRAELSALFPKVNERALGYAVRTQLPLLMVPSEDRWGFPRDTPFALPGIALGKRDPEALVRMHLGAFGPATAADVQAWSGLRGLKAVLADMDLWHDDGLFDLPDAPRPGAGVPAPARFLPEFDSVLLAYADRSRVVPDAHRGEVTTKNLRVRAVFLWDGFAAGTWTVERRRGTATLVATPFAKLPRAARAPLEQEGERLLAFAEPDAKGYAVTFA